MNSDITILDHLGKYRSAAQVWVVTTRGHYPGYIQLFTEYIQLFTDCVFIGGTDEPRE